MYQEFPLATWALRERFDRFTTAVEDVFCPMHVRPIGASVDAFQGTLESTTLGGLRLARVATSAVAVSRTVGDVGKLVDAPYLIKFQLKGESIWQQRRRETHLRPGDFVVASMAEPYRLEFRDAFEMHVLALSPALMRSLTPDPDRFLSVRMSADDADCGLLSSVVAQVVSRMSRLREPIVSRIESNLLDLLGAVLVARSGPVHISPTEKLGQIKAYVEHHLHDRRLGPSMIAAAFHLSTRSVHGLFAAEPLSVGRYIRTRRVEMARHIIATRCNADAPSLTHIALDCGFFDLSHMTRSFREQFGTTPGEYQILCQSG